MSEDAEFIQEWLDFMKNIPQTKEALTKVAQALISNACSPGTLLEEAQVDYATNKEMDQIKTNIQAMVSSILKKLGDKTILQIEEVVSRNIASRVILMLKKKVLDQLSQAAAGAYKRSQESTNLRDQVKIAFDAWTKRHASTHSLIKVIDKSIERSVNKLDALVNNNTLPLKPYEYQNSNFKETLYATKMEADLLPNLLIHELNKAPEVAMIERRIKIKIMHEQVTNARISAMIGSSGCGKTRTIYEYLTAIFGIFITASTSANGGSKDFEELLSQVKYLHPLIRSIQLFYGFQSIVAIRLAFLQRLKIKYGPKLTPYHWLIVQEMPSEIFGEDVFNQLRRKFKISITDTAEVEERMPVFLDEVQVTMCSTDSMMCCSGSDLVFLQTELSSGVARDREISVNLIKLNRKPFSPIHRSFKELVEKNLTFVVSGLQVDEFNEPSDRSIAKRKLRDAGYIKLGSFIKFKPFQEYIRHYLPDLDQNSLKTIHECLRGRYRFTARFISFYLEYKDVQMALDYTVENVVDSILTVLANKFPDEEIFFGRFKCLLEMMYKRFWSGMLVDIFNKLDKTEDAWLIEMGLGLIHAENADLQIFDTYRQVLQNTQIVEPLAFEAIQHLMSPCIKTIKTQYLDYALDQFVKSSSDDPSQLCFLAESLGALQFMKLIEDRRLPYELSEELSGCKLLQKRAGRPFSIVGKVGGYTLLDFLKQDFKSPCGYTYVAITSELKKKVPDVVFVLERMIKGQQQLVLVMLAVKYCKTSLKSDCDSLDYNKIYTSTKTPNTPQNEEFNLLVQKFDHCVRVLIQLGNENEYKELPDWVHLLRVDDLKFGDDQIKTHRDRAPQTHPGRTED